MNYKDIYKFPLRFRFNNEDLRVYDSNNNFVFQFLLYNPKLNTSILNTINNIEKPTIKHDIKYESGKIYLDNIPIILIRGWGNLTGIGGHNLNPKDASTIQDTFAKFIVEQLK